MMIANSSPPILASTRIRTKQGRDAASEFTQRFVSGGVAVHVVDRLEAVEVEHQNRQLPRRADAAKIFIQLLAEETAVGQPGQGIVPRQIARLLLRADARLDFVGDFPIAAKLRK